MRSKITALVAAVAAAAGAASAAKWARGRKDGDEADLEVAEPPVVEAAEQDKTAAPRPATGVGAAEDLTAIKGLGAVKAAKLVAAGVTSYAQIAAWTDDDIAEYGLQVNTSPGQIKREDWVGQARALATPE